MIRRIRQCGLSRSFWRLFRACLFFDVGFGLYFFLINLYLAARNFDEKTIGLITGALTVGNVCATVPIGWLARKFGLRALLVVGFSVAPLLGGARTLTDSHWQQICLAFLQGAAMCCYTVCFPPTLARLTTEEERTAGFSIIFAAGIGSGALAGLAGGWLPVWLQRLSGTSELSSAMRLVLILACLAAACGIPQLTRLAIPEATSSPHAYSGISRVRTFLVPFLMAVAIWNLATGAFAPFASLYLSGVLHVPLPRIGMIFSASQLLQVLGVSAAPILYRALGKVRGIGLLQGIAAVSLVTLSQARHVQFAVSVYLILMCSQYASSPGIYSLAMERTEVSQQASVSAWQNLVSCISIAASAGIGGVLIAKFGYGVLLMTVSAVALLAAVCFTLIDFAPAAFGSKPDRSGAVLQNAGSN